MKHETCFTCRRLVKVFKFISTNYHSPIIDAQQQEIVINPGCMSPRPQQQSVAAVRLEPQINVQLVLGHATHRVSVAVVEEAVGAREA